MDNKHNSLNLAAKICSDICPFLKLCSRKTVRFLEQIMSADKNPSIFSCQMKAIVYLCTVKGKLIMVELKVSRYELITSA